MTVIDNDYRMRIAGQSYTADTMTDPFVWFLGCVLDSRGGEPPEIVVQVADAAMMGAVRQVLPGDVLVIFVKRSPNRSPTISAVNVIVGA